MEEDFEYRGHFVHVQVVGREGRWAWWYSIDNKGVIQNMDRPLKTMQLALTEAKISAKRSIDERS